MSQIFGRRSTDDFGYINKTHRFGSAKHLGEDPAGDWTLNIYDPDSDNTGILHSWSIKVYGHRNNDTVPTFSSEMIDDKEYMTGTAVTEILPAATEGNGTLTYSLTPALPDGLDFNEIAREISGTPTTVTSKTMYTYTVTDDDGDTDQIKFGITVGSDVPTFGGETIDDKEYVTGTAVTETLPVAVGGDGALTYSLDTVPDGLIFDATTRVLSGTPATAMSKTVYTYTVRDEEGDTAELTFGITILADAMPTFSSETIDDREYVTGTAITEMLPIAVGGNGALTYSLIPDLPAGLSFDSNTRVISGTPTNAMSRATYTYTVTDDDGDTAELTFGITILADAMPTFSSETIDDQEYIAGSLITPVTLPTAAGGNASLTYSIIPALPTGLDFNASIREISGTPTTAMSRTIYIYTVTDYDGDTAELTFNITVEADAMPTFSGETIDDQEYIAGSSIKPVTLPDAAGGNGGLRYSLTPPLPTGLDFNEVTRVISGTPTTAVSRTTYTYTVEDYDGDTAELTFNITVEADAMPTFSGETIDDQEYIAGSSIKPVTLPVATGGNGGLRYSITPALPTGLSFTSAIRVISGTPTTAVSKNTYTYTVTDEDGDTTNLTFGITVATDEEPTFSDTITDQEYVAGKTINLPVTLPDAAGGNGGLRYSLTPPLPTGLDFNEVTRVISGTPTTAVSKNTYTYTVTDDDGDTDELMFGITILADSMPDFGGETIDDQEYITGSQITPVTLPEATGGNGTLRYSLTTPLPTGLDFNEVTQEISGTPATATSRTTYTYTVEDIDGDTADLTFSITIEEDSTPDLDDMTISTQMVYTAGSPITLPAATGGNPPVTYSITPDLPAGLSFNEVTQVISGTPRSASSNTYTYTVTDRNGDTDEVRFMLSVEAPPAPRPPTPRRPTTSDTDAVGGGGCAVSDQSNVVSDLFGVMACLMLISVSVLIKRKRRSQIKT